MSDYQTGEKENKTATEGECDLNSLLVTPLESNLFSYLRKEDEREEEELESSCSFPPQITPGQRSGNDEHLSTADDSESAHSVTRTGTKSKKRRQRKSAVIRSKKKSSLHH